LTRINNWQRREQRYRQQHSILDKSLIFFFTASQNIITMSATKTVQDLKASLAKQLPCDTPEATEQARDILQRLEECDITLQVLSDTLVGTVVTKFKSHTDIGEIAKRLIKKWKKLAKSASSAAPAPPFARSVSIASAASTSGAEMEEWADLPPLRKNICNKLHSILELSKPDLTELNANAVSQLCVSRSSEVEASMQATCTGDEYKEKARTLCFNLKKNKTLREELLMGSITAPQLVNMSSEQLATSEKQQEREEEIKKLRDSRRLDWEQANEAKINDMCGIKGDLLQASLFTCGRCKSTKTTSTQKQTRSADEPMTVFVLCMNCGKRWKC
jgi:transcription elongation factor S-II